MSDDVQIAGTLSVKYVHSMRLWLAGVLVACSLGCGGSSDADPNLREVTGTVTANGKPLSNGTVALVSEDGKQAFTGMIGPDGDYEIKASGSAEGALPGQYRVGVQSWSTPPGMADDGKPIEGVLAFDKKFADPSTSGVTITVTDGGGPYDIDLK